MNNVEFRSVCFISGTTWWFHHTGSVHRLWKHRCSRGGPHGVMIARKIVSAQLDSSKGPPSRSKPGPKPPTEPGRSNPVVDFVKDLSPAAKLALFWGISTYAVLFINRLTLWIPVLNSQALEATSAVVMGAPISIQSRADLLAAAASASLLLYSFASKEITGKQTEEVVLEGEWVDEFQSFSQSERAPTEQVQRSFRWLAKTFTSVTNIKSVLIYHRGRTLFRYGVMGPVATINRDGDILSTCLQKQEKLFMANLAIVPGKFEFNYLPPNTQGVLVQPLLSDSALILGANKVRPFTVTDLDWIKELSGKLREDLKEI